MFSLQIEPRRLLGRMFALTGKRVTVVGLGRSGLGAAKLLSMYGARVQVTDTRGESELREALQGLPAGTSLFLGGHPTGLLEDSDLVVVSPGVSLQIEPLLVCREKGIPVIGELELCARVTEVPFVAITGTNGKSTVTTLVGEMIRQGKRDVFMGGNIGVSLCDGLVRIKKGERPEPDWIVAEVSSFQLETIQRFKPKVSAILNLSPDHMDRYDSLGDYLEAKARIFLRQDSDDDVVLNADDPMVASLATSASAQVAWFSRKREVSRGVFLSGDRLCWRLGPSEGTLISSGDIRIRGVHNLENAMAAACMALLAGIPADSVAHTLRTFPGLEHRLEHVRTFEGVTYINDSKATNVGAVEKSLESFSVPVILIAGGRGKKTDFTPLRELVQEHVKVLVLIGESADQLATTLGQDKPVVRAGSMEEAVTAAARSAVPGDVVLLAPACASFDMFLDFEHRGRVFKESVRRLGHETA